MNYGRKYIQLTILLALMAFACSKTQDINPDLAKQKANLNGLWIQTSDCEGCLSIEFSPKELTMTFLWVDFVEKMPYSLITVDSLLTTRKLNGVIVNTKHKIELDSEGFLKINNFIQGLEAYPGRFPGDVSHFHSILLKKIE